MQPRRDGAIFTVVQVAVSKIRPEEGLGRKRDRDGHRELQRSIAQFGVLTPVTVRPAPDGSGQYLLIKGQGRTLACRLLGFECIPAIVVDEAYAESEKVQQFLVENVARLRMRPIDRALLIQRARAAGEETSAIASRFGLSATTVRRLLAQLEDASSREIAALKGGRITLAVHAVLLAHVDAREREEVARIVGSHKLSAKEIKGLLEALEWSRLSDLGDKYRNERLLLMDWACMTLIRTAGVNLPERIAGLAGQFPTSLTKTSAGVSSEVASWK